MRKIVQAASFTFFVFGLIGWLYIAVVALVHPETLTIQLTHFAPWPREDTFGIVSFAVSFVSFFIWNLVKDNDFFEEGLKSLIKKGDCKIFYT